VGEVSSTSTVTQCPVNDVADTTPPSVPARQATSPGISGQTSPPSSIAPATGQKIVSSDELERIAKNAVDAFLKEKSSPADDGQHSARVKILQNAAICAAEANLQRQEQSTPANREKIAGARWLARQALQTQQGFAETENTIALKSYRELFALKKSLEGRLKDQGKGLSAEEKRSIEGQISQASQAALRNVDAWSKANDANSGSNPERYGDAKLCVSGLSSAEETRDLISKSAAEVVQLITKLDQPAAQRAADNR
jgi:hypothetical protein